MQDKKNLGAPMSQQSGLYAHGSIPRRSVLGGLGAAGVLLGVGGSGLLRAANAAPASHACPRRARQSRFASGESSRRAAIMVTYSRARRKPFVARKTARLRPGTR